MGKSKTSPLSKTASVIGAGGPAFATASAKGATVAIGGTGLNASFSQANSNAQPITQLDVDGAQPQQVALNSQANAINNANFSDTDSADYHQLYNGKQYYQNQAMSIDGKIAVMNYLADQPEQGSLYSMSQNMNYALAHGQTLTANQKYVYDNLQASMHNLGYNLTLQRYDHADGINKLLRSAGINQSYDTMTQSQLQKALVGMNYTSKSFLSTSYNDFSKAPGGNPFTNRAVKFQFSAKAKAQALMPGNGPGGSLGEIILSDKNNYKITNVKFDNRKARAKGTQSYTAKGVTVYVDVE